MRKIILPFVAGLMVAASMPPWGWWPLAFVGVSMYGSLALARKSSSPFLTATAFGVGWFLPAMAWMWFLTAPGYLIAVLLFAGLHGLAAKAASTFPVNQHSAALIVFHTLAESLRLSWPFGGVPLATLAIGQSQSPLASLAPLGGVIAMSLAVFWISLSNRKVRAVLLTVVVIGLSNVWDTTRDSGRTVRIAVIQGGGEQGTHAVDSDPREVFDRHMTLTRSLRKDDARDFVLWPENVINVSATGLFADSREYLEISREAKRLETPMVVGITEDAGVGAFTNAHIVVQPDGFVSSRYDKVRRVPFGEYMPMRTLLSSIGAPTDLVPRDARPGDGRAWLDIGDERASVAISWEVFFGGRVNEGVTDGAGFIVNPTNGSSYTWTILQTQQLASSRLRAREQGRWLVQAAPTGFSSFVNPSGDVLDRTDIGEPSVIERTISIREGRTIYSRLGNQAYVVALVVWALWLVQRRSRAIPRGAS